MIRFDEIFTSSIFPSCRTLESRPLLATGQFTHILTTLSIWVLQYAPRSAILYRLAITQLLQVLQVISSSSIGDLSLCRLGGHSRDIKMISEEKIYLFARVFSSTGLEVAAEPSPPLETIFTQHHP
jgi:hypothetical protein